MGPDSEAGADDEYPLVVDNLRLSYGSVEALRGASFRCPVGVTGLMGVNGAGKTSLLRILATLQPAEAGTATVFGTSTSTRQGRRAVRSGLGYVPQAGSLPGHLTTREVVEYMAWLHGVPRKGRAAAVGLALEACRVAEYRNRKVGGLSGGTQRRVLLAQALVHRPRLLLLDEPTAGLDPEQRVLFRELLRDVALGTVTIMSTHLAEDVAHSADEVVVLEQGVCVYVGSVQGLAALGKSTALRGHSALERGFLASRTSLGAQGS